jgi:hypothetical protein
MWHAKHTAPRRGSTSKENNFEHSVQLIDPITLRMVRYLLFLVLYAPIGIGSVP